MAQSDSVTSLPPVNATPSPPAIAALFLVVFDHRKGYVLQWHRSLPEVEVEGVVEFKSLPSGLHHVEEDLVYFVHEDYAGVSAYINKPDAASERNASMLALGVLVPLEHGRMGKSWLHAEYLKELARQQIRHVKAADELEEYWEKHRIDDSVHTKLPDESTDTLVHKTNGVANGYQQHRSMSAASISALGSYALAPHHPALALMEMLNVFGPLVFPLYRAALIRQRILLVTEAPIEFACNLVYNLSVLSSLPRQAVVYLPESGTSSRRIQALFSVGIQDIDLLSRPAADGWIACTTDDLLATKPELYDIAVHLPSKDSRLARKKVYPKIVPSSPDLAKQFPKVGMRASQRDAVRYGGLLEALRAYPKSEVIPEPKSDDEQQATSMGEDVEVASTYSSRAPSIHEHQQIVEPPSWSQVAYTSLLWWASAGDRYSSLAEEEDQEMERDAMLLDEDDDEGRTKEVVVVSYFRRLTSMTFQAVYDALQQGDGEWAIEDDGGRDQRNGEPTHPDEHHREDSFDEGHTRRPLIPQERPEEHEGQDDLVDFTPEDVSAMGLDVWSRSDRSFVEDLLSVWWRRKARVRGGRVECCGVRIL